MSLEKPYRMRVRVLNGKAQDFNKLKGRLVPHVDVIDVKNGIEFVIRAVKEAHLEQVRSKLAAAGLEEAVGGSTDVSPPNGQPPRSETQRAATPSQRPKLKNKPYAFVQLPDTFSTSAPIWHDGTGSEGRFSGEIRCELTSLTPLLVGWERREIGGNEEPWPVPHTPAGEGKVEVHFTGMDRTRVPLKKSVLSPLRAPWGNRPILLPGDSVKGLLRHELGALLGAPMERVAERSYSYRPNSLFPRDPNPRLIARLARIANDSVIMKSLDPTNHEEGRQVRVPVKLDLLPENLKYDKQYAFKPPYYRFDTPGGAPYRGGQGTGESLNSRRRLHERLEAKPDQATLTSFPVPEAVRAGYLHTLRHLIDPSHGHFSERHPDVPVIVKSENARKRILEAASTVVFQPGDLIWVEWDTQEECIVSLGWHYYYRWAYVDTVRRKGWANERFGLFPLRDEIALDEQGAPQKLSAVRRLFGYTGDNPGSKDIGKDDHEQLMGRISVNAAIEVTNPDETDEMRFLRPTFLRELGMPRPSAVEHYLEQPYYPDQRPSDGASLATYGDAAGAGYDEPGKLAGRKFYLDREDNARGDASEANNDRSTLTLEASLPERKFRFTVRFQDLDPAELAAVLIALAPNQFRSLLDGKHANGYCSKLGYARPLGWGSVQIEAKELLLLDAFSDKPALNPVTDLLKWVRSHHERQQMPILEQWLAIHRRKNPDAADYPREKGQIYTYHARLRAEHTRARRYNQGKN